MPLVGVTVHPPPRSRGRPRASHVAPPPATRRLRAPPRRVIALPTTADATPMEFRILGPLEVLDDGRAVALGGSRQRALLALLLLHANETLAADRLIDELWGERAPATAPRMLHVQVSRLRKALADGGPRAGHPRPRLRADRSRRDQLDARRFEDLARAGRARARRRPRGAAPPPRSSAALALWRGAPLADLAYERFAQAEIAPPRRAADRGARAARRRAARARPPRRGRRAGCQSLIGEHPVPRAAARRS